MIHVTMTIFELYVLHGEPWWDDVNTVWIPYPPDPVTMKVSLRYLYVVQLAIWVYTAFSCRFVELRRKDYIEMMVHHIVTILLVAGSWSYNYMRIGLLVLYVHDVSDIFIDLMKMYNYVHMYGASGFFMVEIGYITTLVTWVYWRLYQLPFKIIYCTSIVVHAQLSGSATPGKPWLDFPWHLPGYVKFNILLLALLALHIYWYLLLLRIGLAIVMGKDSHEAGAEKYEGDSEIEPKTTKPPRRDANDDPNQPTNNTANDPNRPKSD